MTEKNSLSETETNVGNRFTRESILKREFDMKQCLAAAEEGDASAQDVLGDCYQYGWNVRKDYVQAVAWYEKASAQGHAAAQRSLGWCYENGYGVEPSKEKAVYWYRKGAEGGDADAQHNLATSYDFGDG